MIRQVYASIALTHQFRVRESDELPRQALDTEFREKAEFRICSSRKAAGRQQPGQLWLLHSVRGNENVKIIPQR